MNQNTNNLFIMLSITLISCFIVCLCYPQEKFLESLNIEMDYKKKENINIVFLTEETDSLNENTQFIVPRKPQNKSCFQWPYEWKYKKNDEDAHSCCNPDTPPQRPFCSTSNIRAKCITCFMCLSFTFSVFGASYLNDDGSFREGCIYCIEPQKGFYGCLGLKLTCAFIALSSSFASCCNQKAWDNGEYCNRCVKKQEKRLRPL